MLLCELYAPKQVLQFICPIAISLATDRVADVRTIAFKLVSIPAVESNIGHNFINELCQLHVCKVVITGLPYGNSVRTRVKFSRFLFVLLIFVLGKSFLSLPC